MRLVRAPQPNPPDRCMARAIARSAGKPIVPNIEPPTESRLPASRLTMSSKAVVNVPFRPRHVPTRP